MPKHKPPIKRNHVGKYREYSFEDFERETMGLTSREITRKAAAAAKPKLTYSQRQARVFVQKSIRTSKSPTSAFRAWREVGGAIRKQDFFDLYNTLEREDKLKAVTAVNRAAKAKQTPIDAWDKYQERTGNRIRFAAWADMQQRAKAKPLKKYVEAAKPYKIENVRRDRLPNVERMAEAGPLFGRAYYYVAELRCMNMESNKDFVRHITVSTDQLLTPEEVEEEARAAFYRGRKGTKVVINQVVVIKVRKSILPASV